MGLYDAIYRRKSIRKYSDEEVHIGVLEELKDYVKLVPKLYNDIDIDVHIVEDGSKIQAIMSGIIGSYGKIKAPHYIVVTSEVKEGYLENVGFALEHIVLKMTDMNIGTCWIGGQVKKNLLNGIINMKANHVPVIVVSFGYPKDENETIKTFVNSRKRKHIKEFFSGNLDSQWEKIMEAVRIAPSAINGQPWRFFRDGNRIDVYSTKKNFLIAKHLETMNRIDIGIALCHLYIAAQNFHKDICFKKELNVANKGYIYILSVFEE
jgi:nitroreductase